MSTITASMYPAHGCSTWQPYDGGHVTIITTSRQALGGDASQPNVQSSRGLGHVEKGVPADGAAAGSPEGGSDAKAGPSPTAGPPDGDNGPTPGSTAAGAPSDEGPNAGGVPDGINGPPAGTPAGACSEGGIGTAGASAPPADWVPPALKAMFIKYFFEISYKCVME